MVVIRLSRAGSKKRPFYHICVSDKRRKRDGNHIEKIGFYNPIANSKEQALKLDKERYDYWKSVGAKSSETVEMLVKRSLMTPEEIEQIENKKSEERNKRKAKLLLKEKEKLDITPSMIQPVKEIKSLGKFKVKVSLHSEIDAEIHIVVESAETIQ